MPRLTNHQYYKRHQFLKTLWEESSSTYAYLEPHQQWDIHAYYIPSHDVSRSELIAHRKTITKQRPSLPNQAGKIYIRLQQALAAVGGNTRRLPKAGTATVDEKGRSIRVSTVVRPEIDAEKLARGLLELAAQQNEEERAMGRGQ